MDTSTKVQSLFHGEFKDLPEGEDEFIDENGEYRFWSGEGDIKDPETWNFEHEVYGEEK